jgi:hypothetical protein
MINTRKSVQQDERINKIHQREERFLDTRNNLEKQKIIYQMKNMKIVSK